MPHVYILKTDSGKLYIGSTSNLERRITHHSGGHTPSTKRLGDPKLIFKQEYSTLIEARAVERKLKKLKRRDYIEKIIKEGKIRVQP
ncbi:GIY-YIG nuclease family protein [Candidatus Parcubacteria bacterium]|nr:GIY-YIG nuclease family protein [Candidatus Parcubacteria bacterium]